jgi:hypothetical protein
LKRLRDIESKKEKIIAERQEQVERIKENEKQRRRLQKSELRNGRIAKTKVELLMIENERNKLEKAKQRLENARMNVFKSYKDDVDKFDQVLVKKVGPSSQPESASSLDKVPKDPLALTKEELEKGKTAEVQKSDSSGRLLSAGTSKKVQKILAENQKSPEQFIDNLKSKNEIAGDLNVKKAQREKKLLVNVQDSQEARLKVSEEDQIYMRLIHDSHEERRIAAEIALIRHEKEIMIRNRLFREQQYKEQREQDFREALNREAILAKQAKLEYQNEASLLLKQHNEILQVKAAKKHENITAFCRQAAQQIVQLSLKMAELRTLNDGVVPKRVYKQWISLFIAGQPIEETYHMNATDDAVTFVEESEFVKPEVSQAPLNTIPEQAPIEGAVNPPSVSNFISVIPKDSVVFQGIRFLDNVEFDDYLKLQNDWAVLPA